MTLTLGVALLAGLVSFLSPCVFPLVPAYIGYLSGRVSRTVSAQMAGGAGRVTAVQRVSTLVHGVMFVLGFTLVFVVFGLLTTACIRQVGGQNLSLARDVIARAGGLLIIFFGLQFMGVLPALIGRGQARGWSGHAVFSAIVLAVMIGLALWALVDWLLAVPVIAMLVAWFVLGGAFTRPTAFWARTFGALQRVLYADTRRQMAGGGRQTFASSLLMGVIFAAGWTPCIGPIYGSILTLAATGGDVGQAGALMVAYSLGLGLPFLLCALLLDGAQGVLRRMRRAIRYVEVASGVFMVAIGILVASGRLQMLSQNFATQFADLSYRLEDCALDLSNGDIGLGEFGGCVSGETAASDPGA